MSKNLGLSILIATTLGFTASIFADEPLTGHYQCQGYDPIEQTKYQDAQLTVTEHNDHYDLHWQYQDGSQYKGKALANDDEETLSAIFKKPHDSSKQDMSEAKYGLQVYEVDDEEPQLEGKWLYYDDKQVGHESCDRLSDLQTASNNHDNEASNNNHDEEASDSNNNHEEADNGDNDHDDANHDDDNHDDENGENNNHNDENGED